MNNKLIITDNKISNQNIYKECAKKKKCNLLEIPAKK